MAAKLSQNIWVLSRNRIERITNMQTHDRTRRAFNLLWATIRFCIGKNDDRPVVLISAEERAGR